MRDLRIDEVIKFTAMDEFTGQEIELIGVVIGNYIKVRKQYPEEYGEASDDLYLVEVGNRSGLFIVALDEVLEVIGE
jgi:hypothetical protein